MKYIKFDNVNNEIVIESINIQFLVDKGYLNEGEFYLGINKGVIKSFKFEKESSWIRIVNNLDFALTIGSVKVLEQLVLNDLLIYKLLLIDNDGKSKFINFELNIDYSVDFKIVSIINTLNEYISNGMDLELLDVNRFKSFNHHLNDTDSRAIDQIKTLLKNLEFKVFENHVRRVGKDDNFEECIKIIGLYGNSHFLNIVKEFCGSEFIKFTNGIMIFKYSNNYYSSPFSEGIDISREKEIIDDVAISLTIFLAYKFEVKKFRMQELCFTVL